MFLFFFNMFSEFYIFHLKFKINALITANLFPMYTFSVVLFIFLFCATNFFTVFTPILVLLSVKNGKNCSTVGGVFSSHCQSTRKTRFNSSPTCFRDLHLAQSRPHLPHSNLPHQCCLLHPLPLSGRLSAEHERSWHFHQIHPQQSNFHD